MRKIEDLEEHLELQGIKYDLFVHIAEASWNEERKQYIGVRSMARILGKTDLTISKYLKIYDKKIGRKRHDENKQ